MDKQMLYKQTKEDYQQGFYKLLYESEKNLSSDDMLKLLLDMDFALNDKMQRYRLLMLRHIEIGIVTATIKDNPES